MVGADTLLTIHRRLCDIMCNTSPFGGMSMICVGDLLQLPPVGQRAVFSEPSDEMASIYGSLWKTHFQIIQLTEVQRQKGNESFSNLLNRIRIGQHTVADIEVLNSQHISQTKPDYPAQATHVFAYNRDVQHHNSTMLQTLTSHCYTLNAKDSKRDEQTRRIEITSFPDMSGGLPKELILGIGARVILTKNLDVTDGLVNSAAGVVTGFLPSPDPDDEAYSPKFILVKFDDERIGRKKRQVSKAILPDDKSTPISTVELPVRIGNNTKVTSKRTQFPLVHAWGVTIHKEQGKTEDKLVVSCKGSFNAGQFYTAISRTKGIDGLFLLDQVTPTKIKVNIKSLEEITRMVSESPFISKDPITFTMPMENYIKLNIFNINSLIPHTACLLKDNVIQNSHVTCLLETWLLPNDQHPLFPTFTALRKDRHEISINKSPTRGGGLLTYVHSDLYLITERRVPNVEMEYMYTILAPAENNTIRIALLLIYNNPKTDTNKFLCDIERLVSSLPCGIPAFITGDFNINILKKTSITNKCLQLMNYYGFQQIVKLPTHRRGGLLDHFYTNIRTENTGITLDTVPTYYSDHMLLSIAIQKWTLLQ